LVERLDWFKNHYDIISHHTLGSNSERVDLGGKATGCSYLTLLIICYVGLG